MGIDHVIDYDCVPKQTLSTHNILARLKAQQRANAIIRLYRNNGDMRPPKEMGFEMVRRAADGSEEIQVVIVQDLLDQGDALKPLGKHCSGCPANVLSRPYGCFNNINYPISQAGEIWLLKQIPTPDDPLVFLLLRQALVDFNPQGGTSAQMRAQEGVFFQSKDVLGRKFEEFTITTDQIFEIMFLPEVIRPLHAALLLLIFGAIPRNLDAQQLMDLTPAQPDKPIPFVLEPDASDDETIDAIKYFLEALHRAHQLNTTLSLDV